jgi:hypothetical protein
MKNRTAWVCSFVVLSSVVVSLPACSSREKQEAIIREEIEKEFAEQTQRVLSLLNRYHSAMQKLILEVTVLLANEVYVSMRRDRFEFSVDVERLNDEVFSMDVKDNVQRRLDKISGLLSGLGKGLKVDVKEIDSCKNGQITECNVTPDGVIKALLSVYPDYSELLSVAKDFQSIQDDVQRMLSEDYWKKTANKKTADILRRMIESIGQ